MTFFFLVIVVRASLVAFQIITLQPRTHSYPFTGFPMNVWQFQPWMILLLPRSKRFLCLEWRIPFSRMAQKLVEQFVTQRFIFATRIRQHIFVGHVIQSRYGVQTAIGVLFAQKCHRFRLCPLEISIKNSKIGLRRDDTRHLQWTECPWSRSALGRMCAFCLPDSPLNRLHSSPLWFLHSWEGHDRRHGPTKGTVPHHGSRIFDAKTIGQCRTSLRALVLAICQPQLTYYRTKTNLNKIESTTNNASRSKYYVRERTKSDYSFHRSAINLNPQSQQ